MSDDQANVGGPVSTPLKSAGTKPAHVQVRLSGRHVQLRLRWKRAGDQLDVEVLALESPIAWATATVDQVSSEGPKLSMTTLVRSDRGCWLGRPGLRTPD